MTETKLNFEPWAPICPGTAEARCLACITIPARNEAESLGRCLDALEQQRDLQGHPLPPQCYEVLLLLNNCTDTSAQVAFAWQKAHPSMRLQIVERTLPSQQAHVGTARRMLMDTALYRMQHHAGRGANGAILSTDADTTVSANWLAENLHALQSGADVVGGAVAIREEDLAALPEQVQRCYHRDREYAQLIAELEDLLDPQEGDAWPRHLDHFGSSLACTPWAYAEAGGMPSVSPLEDEAFIDQVRRACLGLRHAPKVRVYTSPRMNGRAVMGLAGQFRLWNSIGSDGEHYVASAAFLEHRFTLLRRLRQIFHTKDLAGLALPTEWWVQTFQEALRQEANIPAFLRAVYCDILIQESFHGAAQEPIEGAIDALRKSIALARAMPA